MRLADLGFTEHFRESFALHDTEGFQPARVSLEHKGSYVVLSETGEMPAVPVGRMYHEADRDALPVVGDWVAVRTYDEQPPKAIIHAVLPRRTKFSRKEPGGRTAEQAIAANVDTVFVVMGLDGDFSARRVERYLTLTWESGAEPVVLLTESDLCGDLEGRVSEVMGSAPAVPVHALSVPADQGVEVLSSYLVPGRTIALLGSSGAGKSTILNHLLGAAVQKTQGVRDTDSRGRHTTTTRQMFVLPCGALVIDTPGMRELQLWSSADGLSAAFSDIEEIALGCRFRDCSHVDEPGCAVMSALAGGDLGRDRYESYLKLSRELSYLRRKHDVGAASAERAKWKKIHKQIKQFPKH